MRRPRNISRGAPRSVWSTRPRSEQEFLLEPERGEAVQQLFARGRGVPEAEPRNRFLPDTSRLHVGTSLRASVSGEGLLEQLLRSFVYREERVLRLPRRRALFDGDARATRQRLHRRCEVRVLRAHDEREDVSAGRAGAETAPFLCIRENHEGRCPLLVKRATRVVVLS